MEGPRASAKDYSHRQRLAIGLAVGAGAALLLSFVVNHVYMSGGDLTASGLLSRLFSGAAFRLDMAEMFPVAFFDVLQSHGQGLQGVFVLGFLALFLLPSLFSYFGGRFGLRALGGMLLGYILFSLAAVLPQLAVSAGLIPLLAAGAATWSARRNGEDFFGLALCCGSLLAAITLSFGLFSLFSGRDIFALFSGTLARMLGDFLSRISQVTLQSDAFLPYFTPVEGQVFFRNLFLSFFLCTALLVGVFDFLLSAKGAKADAALSFRPASFRTWRLPNSFVIAMMILCIFGELGKRMGWRDFDTVTSCFFIIFAFALGVQGLSTLVFLGLQMRSFWPLLIAGLLSFRAGPSIFAFVGLFEQFFNMRTRLQIMALASYLAAQDRRQEGRRGRDGMDEEDVGEMIGRMGEMNPKDLATLQQEIFERQEREEKEERQKTPGQEGESEERREGQEKEKDEGK